MHHFLLRRRVIALAAGSAAMALAKPGRAQAYPAKPITMVIGSTPGGILDTVGRIVAKGIEKLGQPVVVQNLPGAGSNIATAALARAPADGYTIAMVPTSFAINPSVYSKLAFDTKNDFQPLSHSVNLANVLIVHPSVPARSLKEFIQLARSRNGSLTYGSAGNGQSNHLSAEMFKAAADIQMTHVPYKGSAAAMTDLLGGNIDAMFVDALSATPHIKAGTLRALAVSGAARLPILPEVPTFAESGFPKFDASSWLGVVARKGTPPEILVSLSATAMAVMRDPEVKSKLIEMGVQPVGSDPGQFNTFLNEQYEYYAIAVRKAGVKLD
jgi:tripartite-type tricarboxylate transporter receptor subunit TctC